MSELRRARERLAVAADASPQSIREAYLARLKEFPPEKHPEEFQEVRRAYEILNDARGYFKQQLNSPAQTLTELLAEQGPPRRLARGPAAWLKAMEQK